MSFTDVVKAVTESQDTSIIAGKLIQYMDKYESTYANDSYFHVSSLYYMCPKLEIYQRILPPELFITEQIDAMKQSIFDIGHAIHYWYQNFYLGPMRVLFGSWLCLRCGHVIDNTLMPEDPCPKCVDKEIPLPNRWEYIETPVLSEEWNIKGKVDGILHTGGEEYVLDIKTSGSEWFKKLKKPWPSAVCQVQTYMWLLGIQKGVLLYSDKGSKGPVPVREFSVPYSEDTIDDVKSKVTSFNMGMETKKLPRCRCKKNSFGVTCADIEKVVGVKEFCKEWGNS